MSFGIPVRNGLAVGLLASTFLSSLRIGGRPAMFLNFIGTNSLDSRVTFTRASTATFVGSNGLIQTAAINAPRFDYDPVTLAPRGLLIEEQRANLLTYSEDFSNGIWAKTGATIGSNAVVAPDGNTTADNVVEDGSTGLHITQQFFTFVTATAYTISLFIKPGIRTWVQVFLPTAAFGAAQGGYFNLSGAGALGNVTGAPTSRTITAFPNGWYRITITATSTAAAGGNIGIAAASANGTNSYAGSNGSTALSLWGADLEAGAFVTSYIPTVAGQVTRTPDIATMTGANFSSWFNATQGTFTFSGDSAYGSGGLIGSTPTTGAILYANTNASRTFNGTNFVGTANTYTNNAVFSTALGYSATGRSIVLNGGTVATDANLIQTPTAITLGGAFGGGYLNGHIRAINYYNTRLPNTTLRTLTS